MARGHEASGRALATILAVGLAMAAGDARAAEITVVGEGRVAAVPDMATLTLGVRERAETAEGALDATARAMAALMAQLEGAGIAPRDVQTSQLSLQPLWRSDPHRDNATLEGFEAATGVQVRLRDPQLLGGVLGVAVAAGANRFDGLQFGLSDPEALADEARRRAVADALRKGAVHAEAAGLTLGPVHSIVEEGSALPRPSMMRGMDAAMEAMPIAAGEMAVTARVTVVFAPAP